MTPLPIASSIYLGNVHTSESHGDNLNGAYSNCSPHAWNVDLKSLTECLISSVKVPLDASDFHHCSLFMAMLFNQFLIERNKVIYPLSNLSLTRTMNVWI